MATLGGRDIISFRQPLENICLHQKEPYVLGKLILVLLASPILTVLQNFPGILPGTYSCMLQKQSCNLSKYWVTMH